MFEFEDFLRYTNSLLTVILLISLCALWFAYRANRIAEKSFKIQTERDKKQGEREKDNKFQKANKSALKAKTAGENIVRNINKHLLKFTMTRENKNSLYTIREEMVHTVGRIDKLIQQMSTEKKSVENLNYKIMEKIQLHSIEIKNRGDEIVELFEENDLKVSHISE